MSKRFVTDAVVAWGVPGQVLALVETAARDTANRIGQVLIPHALQVPAGHQPGPVTCGQGHPVRMAGSRARTIRTALGPVRLERHWWHCAVCHTGFAPAEARYGVNPAGTSPGYDKILALAGTDHPFRASARLIAELTGIRLAPASTIARTTGRVGTAARHRADAEAAAIKAGTLTPLLPGQVPEHRLDNGLLLRSDVHILFDQGYLGIDDHHRIQVSPRLRSDFGNGAEFYSRAGVVIDLPERRAERPSREAVTWHMDTVFLRLFTPAVG